MKTRPWDYMSQRRVAPVDPDVIEVEQAPQPVQERCPGFVEPAPSLVESGQGAMRNGDSAAERDHRLGVGRGRACIRQEAPEQDGRVQASAVRAPARPMGEIGEAVQVTLKDYPHEHPEIEELRSLVGQLQRIVIEQADEINRLRGRGAWLAEDVDEAKSLALAGIGLAANRG
jgi:hypothetical protein